MKPSRLKQLDHGSSVKTKSVGRTGEVWLRAGRHLDQTAKAVRGIQNWNGKAKIDREYYLITAVLYSAPSRKSTQERSSGGATPGRARAIALAEIPPPLLPPWLSKVVAIKLYIKTAVVDATNDLYMPCHEQRTGAAIEYCYSLLLYRRHSSLIIINFFYLIYTYKMTRRHHAHDVAISNGLLIVISVEHSRNIISFIFGWELKIMDSSSTCTCTPCIRST